MHATLFSRSRWLAAWIVGACGLRRRTTNDEQHDSHTLDCLEICKLKVKAENERDKPQEASEDEIRRAKCDQTWES